MSSQNKYISLMLKYIDRVRFPPPATRLHGAPARASCLRAEPQLVEIEQYLDGVGDGRAAIVTHGEQALGPAAWHGVPAGEASQKVPGRGDVGALAAETMGMSAEVPAVVRTVA